MVLPTSKRSGRIFGSVTISVGQLLEGMLLDTLESRKLRYDRQKESRRLNAQAKRESLKAEKERFGTSRSGGATTKRKAGTPSE
jgi:hypothetical protein